MPETSFTGGKSKLIPVILVVLVVVFAVLAFYYQGKVSDLKQNPQQVAQAEVQELVNKVAKLIVLPEGERPTVATVTDPEPLRGQAFFANAQRGDRVLLYTGARKAILYSPSQNKIVEVGSVNIAAQQAAGGESGGTEAAQ